jgi:hypothetical protein
MLIKGHKIPRIEHSTVHLYQHYPLHNKLQYTWPGDYWVSVACPTPRLNLKFELRPSWNDHNTFTIATMQHTTELLSVRCEVKARRACTYEESMGVQHHLRGNQGPRESNTTGPASKRERTLPVQGSRVSRLWGWGIRQQEKQLWFIEPARVSLLN